MIYIIWESEWSVVNKTFKTVLYEVWDKWEVAEKRKETLTNFAAKGGDKLYCRYSIESFEVNKPHIGSPAMTT
jgi:hypothetical protein